MRSFTFSLSVILIVAIQRNKSESATRTQTGENGKGFNGRRGRVRVEFVKSGLSCYPAVFSPLRLTDQCLHHKLVLKVEDLVAVESLSLLDTCKKGEMVCEFMSGFRAKYLKIENTF